MARSNISSSLHDQELFWRLIEIDKALSSEKDKWKLYERILMEAQALTNADGGTLYLVNDACEAPRLDYVIVRNAPLNLSIINKRVAETGLKPIPIYDPDTLRPNRANIASHCALIRKTIYIDKAYAAEDYDISGIQSFDRLYGYKTHNLLTIPLSDHSGQVIGVIQLVNARSTVTNQVIPFSPESINVAEALASLVSMVIDNHIMMEEQRDLLIRISSKQETGELFEAILTEAQRICHAEGGTLYLLNRDQHQPCLRFAIIRNSNLNIHQGGTAAEAVNLPDIPLYLENGEPNHQNIASFTALTKQLVNIPDAYADQRFDFSGTKRFDEQTGYRSTSFLSIPLINHENDVIGVLQLVNATNPRRHTVIPFGSRIEPIIKALSSYAAIALENQILLEDHKKLLDAFIKCIARAIDAKSPHTSAHCQRVPVLTEMLAQATCEDTRYFPEFNLNEQQWYELHVAAWLHDCGKLSTPDSILDKSTKLHGLHDGLETILARMKAMGEQWKAEFYQDVVAGKKSMNEERELNH
ncbi:MAG: GAF domain-containing protein, partial [Ketobacteraceae bacterium]|nr:GAF domain-containing protein [Ketobacteraceae bacterium]